MKCSYDKKLRARAFKPGDWVLHTRQRSNEEPNRGKLGENWEGPFIIERLSSKVEGTDFNVLDHDAKSDGKSDCAKAFLEAWQAACHTPKASKQRLVIPGGYICRKRGYVYRPMHGLYDRSIDWNHPSNN
ncbi:hypothetical protein IFM89_030037 [Coptis chinensis]|uniref:Uncharacterized protein n=1 Tax=Coptis chinensis TaxID=261450 RepID=A0A835MCM3_9MAGN|nr:hypothetical protein IFM89_030037 [Coptis chinensis]